VSWQDAHIDDYVVCIIDVLGIGEQLKLWNTCKADSPATFAPIMDSVLPVIHFQTMFAKFFKHNQEWRDPATLGRELPQGMVDVFLKETHYRLGTQQFSDTFVFYAPTYNGEKPSAVPIVLFLTACSLAMIDSLANGHPVRGALTVGFGIELDEHNFFGPAFAEAHSLESKVAGYPRVVVSDEAIAFIQQEATQKPVDDASRRMKNFAIMCGRLITRDSDGQFVVDYLGQQLHDPMPTEERQKLAMGIKAGYEFALSEWRRFQDEKNQRLTLRYHLLLEYIESRLALWGIDVIERQQTIGIDGGKPSTDATKEVR
jgi:hypothetical protein